QGQAPCLSGNRSGLLLLVHLALFLVRLFLVAFLLVHLLVLGGLFHLLGILRDGTRRREGGSGHGRKHRGDDQGQQLAHFVLLWLVFENGWTRRVERYPEPVTHH